MLVLAGITWGMEQTWTQWQPDATPKRFMALPAGFPGGEPAKTAVAPPSMRDKPIGGAKPPRRPAAERQGLIGLLLTVSQPSSLWTSWLSLIALAALISAAGWATRDKWLE